MVCEAAGRYRREKRAPILLYMSFFPYFCLTKIGCDLAKFRESMLSPVLSFAFHYFLPHTPLREKHEPFYSSQHPPRMKKAIVFLILTVTWLSAMNGQNTAIEFLPFRSQPHGGGGSSAQRARCSSPNGSGANPRPAGTDALPSRTNKGYGRFLPPRPSPDVSAKPTNRSRRFCHL